MSVFILIPSSNIYNIENNNYSRSNKISSCSIKTQRRVGKFGSILKNDEITIRFWQAEPLLSFIGDDPDQNTFEFERLHDMSNGNRISRALEPIIFDIDKLSYLSIDSEGFVDNATLVIKTKEFNWATKEYTESTERYYNKVLKYDKSANTLTYWQGGTESAAQFIDYNATTQEYLIHKIFSVETDYLEFEDKELSDPYGYAGETDFTFPTNELVQRDNKYLEEQYPNKAMSDTKIAYSNGKEVFTIKCSIADYYTLGESLAISPENSSYPMLFQKGMQIIPYVFSPKGEIPLSTKADGTAKSFEVIGTDFEFVGVPWQILTIQELT